MKHQSIIISVKDLSDRVFAESDSFSVEEALGLEEGEKPQGTHCLVSWPEHVVVCRFNGDANYGDCDSIQTLARDNPEAGIYAYHSYNDEHREVVVSWYDDDGSLLREHSDIVWLEDDDSKDTIISASDSAKGVETSFNHVGPAQVWLAEHEGRIVNSSEWLADFNTAKEEGLL